MGASTLMILYAVSVFMDFASEAAQFFTYAATHLQGEGYKQFLAPSRPTKLVASNPRLSISTETNLDHIC